MGGLDRRGVAFLASESGGTRSRDLAIPALGDILQAETFVLPQAKERDCNMKAAKQHKTLKQRHEETREHVLRLAQMQGARAPLKKARWGFNEETKYMFCENSPKYIQQDK
jgi:hypothetical protein